MSKRVFVKRSSGLGLRTAGLLFLHEIIGDAKYAFDVIKAHKNVNDFPQFQKLLYSRIQSFYEPFSPSERLLSADRRIQNIDEEGR